MVSGCIDLRRRSTSAPASLNTRSGSSDIAGVGSVSNANCESCGQHVCRSSQYGISEFLINTTMLRGSA
jgi:hypothetical protein